MQDETIRTLEGGNLAELVELQVLGGRVDGVDLNDLEVDLVGLRDGADGRGASVSLLQPRQYIFFESQISGCVLGAIGLTSRV